MLQQFSKGLIRTVGRWLVASDAADQVGYLVVKPVRQDGIRVPGYGIADYPRLRNARESRGLAQAGFGSRVEANALHEIHCITTRCEVYYACGVPASRPIAAGPF